MIQVYEIKIPVYAESEAQAEEARIALHTFVASHRQRGIPVTATKVTQALARLTTNRFIASQIERFLQAR